MAEADGGFDQEQELAKAAKAAFDNHRYEQCLTTLKKLVESRQEDARIMHNKAVAQYLLSNLTKTDEFRNTLQAVEAQFEREAEATGSPVSVTEKSFMLFNKAFIHQRLKQNSKAQEILEQLFSVYESLNKQLAVQICLLLIEVYLITYQCDKATEHIELLERRLFGGPLSNGGQRNDKDKDDGGMGGTLDVEKFKPYIYQFRGRLNLLHKNVKQCKKEVKSLTTLTGPTACGQFLKANVEYLRGNYRKALKVLCTAPKVSIVTEAGECLSSFLFNNIGVIHYEVGKYSLAAHYFKKSVDENDAALNGYPPLDRAAPLSGRPLSVLGVNNRHILLYNLGLQLLYAGHPLPAFESLLEVVQVYHSNPRLWLRLAEACIGSHIKSQKDQVNQMRNKSETVQMVVGSGLHRKLIVAPLQWTPPKSQDSHSHSSAMPAPTLEFASICLQNAHFLLPRDSTYWEEKDGKGDVPIVSAFPSPPMTRDSVIDLRNSILACKAYVSLGLGDPVMALSAAQKLLDVNKLPGGLKYVAQLYVAESLIQLGQEQEAMQYLDPEDITDLSTNVSPTMVTSEGDPQDAPPVRPKATGPGVDSFPPTVASARVTMFHNLSSAYCLRKDYESAKKALQQSVMLLGNSGPFPPQTILLSAYIEIMLGNMTQALNIIKKHQPFPIQRNTQRTLGSAVSTHIPVAHHM